MADLSFTAGDTAPSIYGDLTVSGVAMDLSVAASVRFQMRPSGSGAYTVDAVAVVDTPATSGIVHYDWAETDLDAPGEYRSRWEITWADNTVQHTEPENTITVTPA